MIFKVIIDIESSVSDRVFDYYGEGFFQIGQRVRVPFGNKMREGFIVAESDDTDVPQEKLKAIAAPLDDFCAINPDQLELAQQMRQMYNLRLADALRLFIPAQMRRGRVKKLELRVCRLSSQAAGNIEKTLESLPKNAKNLRGLVTHLAAAVSAPSAELNKQFGTALNRLCGLGIVEITAETALRSPYKSSAAVAVKPVVLTPRQAAAVAAITADQTGQFLLFGVTGSGKTEVYMRVLETALAQNKTAIMLVPEISLTPTLFRLLRARFSGSVAILHSNLSAGERYDEWLRLKTGEARIAVGARSAVFAPLQNIGVIIIDEEHDPSYKSSSNPRYDTIEVAKLRRARHNCALVLGSATPSLESYHAAETGALKLLELPERINNRPLPDVLIVDMLKEVRAGNKDIFSAALVSALGEVVQSGKQAILFLNRRGYSSFVMCGACGYVARCEDCDVSLTFHSEDNLLKCHYCGRRYKMLDLCPACKSPNFRRGRVGTQQIVERVQRLFPDVKTLRMDFDTTQTKEAHDKILESFRKKEAQILIGTQMVAKGHDFPDVTLVGILDGDQSLYHSDYLSGERTFALLTQVAGRSGRDKSPGRVILQTHSPTHYCLVLASRQDYVGFYKKEINLRLVTRFPPFAAAVRVLYSGENSDDCIKLLNTHYALIEGIKNAEAEEFILLSRMKSPIHRVQKKFRYQILMRIERGEKTKEILGKIFAAVNSAEAKGVSVFCEINPQNLS